MCWKLRKCLYGIRDAPKLWEGLYTRTLINMGFRAGKASASCFCHPKLDVRCVVHGGDFTFSGSDEALNWIQGRMEKELLCNIEGRMGGGPQDVKQA